MLKLHEFVKYWSPVLIWFCLIFAASSDQKSFQHSSRIIGPLVHWLFPKLSEPKVREIVTWVRKGAHVTEFAVLAVLIWRALRKPFQGDPRPWSWRVAGLALLGVALYAATDEVHQAFVPSRQASALDVLIDCTGGVLGLLLLRAIGRRLRLWPVAARS